MALGLDFWRAEAEPDDLLLFYLVCLERQDLLEFDFLSARRLDSLGLMLPLEREALAEFLDKELRDF